jgi:type VI secretion system (T6SS) phospholipase Tle1-like effector
MKNLILCLDGTWSDADSPAPQTNIAIIAAIIDPRPVGGAEQRVYYDAGVGTGGVLDRVLGGAFGRGLSANTLAAYRFLSQFYRPGDNIYVFGFSRGAFTARSLCGFLSASGLLTEDACNAANLEFAWSYYRTAPKARFPADRARLRRITHSDEPRIKFLGVFDTVGALGIPRGFMSRLSRRAIQFHDADVSSIVDYCCHALAIDEQRLEFEAAVWTEPRHRKYRAVEQAWFPGAHANVGGGCEDSGLSDLALDWMLKRLARYCPELRLSPQESWPRQLTPSYRGQLYDARSWMFWRSRWRPLVRLINRCGLERAWRCRLPDIRPHSRPIGEMVHWSALARWEETKANRRRQRYQPRNLVAALQSVQDDKTPVVGLDGEPTSLLGLYKATGAQDKATGAQAPAANGAAAPRPSANGAGEVGEAAQARSAGR